MKVIVNILFFVVATSVWGTNTTERRVLPNGGESWVDSILFDVSQQPPYTKNTYNSTVSLFDTCLYSIETGRIISYCSGSATSKWYQLEGADNVVIKLNYNCDDCGVGHHGIVDVILSGKIMADDFLDEPVNIGSLALDRPHGYKVWILPSDITVRFFIENFILRFASTQNFSNHCRLSLQMRRIYKGRN